MKNFKFQISNFKLADRDPKTTDTGQDNSSTTEHLPQRHKFPIWLGILIFIAAILILPIIIANVIFLSAGVGNYLETFGAFVFPNESKIESQDGRVNMAILGIGGKGHAGGELTDTIIFSSVSLSSHSATLISIPRDIWIPEIRAKINTAYYWGETQPGRGGGMSFAKQIISSVTGQKVNYTLVVDFFGFRDIIDTIGGIDVNVENGFTDKLYPVAGKENDTCGGDPLLSCRYKTISFQKGVIHMDGETALEFARSREGDNGENTDFARSARQQKIISAVGKKALSFGTIINPIKDYKILKTVKASVKTDLSPTAIGVLAKNILFSRNNIKSETFPLSLVKNPPILSTYDRQYVLIPAAGNGNWKEINAWVDSILD